MSKVRGIRFTQAEEKLIGEFLEKNPLIDFSTMAKIAILEFVKNPMINLNAVGKTSRKKDAKNVRPI